MNPSCLHVKDISNGTSNSYLIPLKATIAFPQNTTLSYSVGKDITFTNSRGANVNETLYLTTTILPHFSPKEYLDGIVTWLSPINSVWTFFAAIGVVIVPLVMKMYGKQKKSHDNTSDNKGSISKQGAPFE
jgi:hypothetical protein